MAKLSKQLHLKKGSTETVCSIYGTTSEAGSVYVSCTVDSQNAYIPLVSTSDTRATVGRATKGGTTYAIGKGGVVPYANSGVLTTSGTFTVPTDVYGLRVTCVGGGAGGVTGFHGKNSPVQGTRYTHVFAVSGGTTTFGSVSASGGTSPTVTGIFDYTPEEPGEYGHPEYDLVDVESYTLGTGYYNSTYHYNSTSAHQGAAVPITDINGTQVGTAGQGGKCDENNRARVNFTGASGYRTQKVIAVTPGQTISYTIGAGGPTFHRGSTDYKSGSSNGYGYSPGKAGAIFVEWGQGI